VLSQEGGHGLGQLILPLAGEPTIRRQEQHQAQHVAFAENGRGHGGGVAVVSVGDGQGLVRANKRSQKIYKE